MKNIKQILLEDDTTLLNVVRELNAIENNFSELNYYSVDEKNYILEHNNKSCTLDDIIVLCKEKIDKIINAMLENYNNIDVCNSELEDYIEDNYMIPRF